MKSSTEILRRLLDERGAEYDGKTYEGVTFWNEDTNMAVASEGYDEKLWVSQSLTPEQAIEATLGRGTCHPIISDNLTESEGTGDAWADCSECGHLLFVLTDPNSQPPKYCPNCGRRIEQ